MDIASIWRSMRADPAEAPHPGAHQQVAGEGITIAVTQQCQATLPLAGFTADEVTVTVTSHRPGVAAQVSIGANLNSPDGSYQGPTTTVGQGQFTTAARSRSVLVLPFCPPAGLFSASVPRPSGRTEHHTVLPWSMSSLRAIPGSGGGGRSGFWTC